MDDRAAAASTRPKKPRSSAKAESRRAAALAEQAAYDASWMRWVESNPALAAALVAAAGGLAFLVWRYAPWRALRAAATGGAAAGAGGAGAKSKRKGGPRKVNTGAGNTAASSAGAAASAQEDADRAASPVTPVGFKNVGNTCFLNALLQVSQGRAG